MRRGRLERKGCVVDLYHKATGDLAKIADWTEDSLGYAREHGQRKLGWLLEAVRVEVELENALLALPLGEHLGPERASARENTVQENGRASDVARGVLERKREDEKSRARLVDWELFEEGLVALMRNGKVSYKHVDELAPEDRPARIAANRARTTWLKERRDGWLGRGEVS